MLVFIIPVLVSLPVFVAVSPLIAAVFPAPMFVPISVLITLSLMIAITPMPLVCHAAETRQKQV
jgi:uncharacterized membrane protein